MATDRPEDALKANDESIDSERISESTLEPEEPVKICAQIRIEDDKVGTQIHKDRGDYNLEVVEEALESLELPSGEAKENEKGTKIKEGGDNNIAIPLTNEGKPATPSPNLATLPNSPPMPRHPLQTPWTLWFMDGDKRKNHDSKWGTNLIEIFTIRDIEDWWLLYSYILLPSKLRVKNDYMLFRENIEPKWEDPMNKNGGKWQLVLPNKFRVDKLDAMWLTTILSMIGETYGDLGTYVNGAYLQRRQKEDRISLWTKSADKRFEEQTTTIGKMLKTTLHLSEKSQLHYLKHEDVNYGNVRMTNQSWGRRNQEHNRLYHV